MGVDYSNKKLQKTSFIQKDISNASFSGSDLRGADFSGSNLSGSDLTRVRTGITAAPALLIYAAALVFSLFAGEVAMLAGETIQEMLAAKDSNIRAGGMAIIVITILFILFYYFIGGRRAIRHLMMPVNTAALIIVMIVYASGFGTRMGMLYVILALLLIVVMFVIGTIARTVAGSLSIILFLVVVLSGGIFGKSPGGVIGTAIMATSCALISKRALQGANGFDRLRKIAAFFTRKFGTSFRNCTLAGADFSYSKIYNADFSGADISGVQWRDTRKINCVFNQTIITEKKGQAQV